MARRKTRKKNKTALLIVFILVLGVIGYYLYTNEDTDSIVPKVEKKHLKIVDENSKSRPYAVMINNNHEAWPHAGLQDAYITYEIMAEGKKFKTLLFRLCFRK